MSTPTEAALTKAAEVLGMPGFHPHELRPLEGLGAHHCTPLTGEDKIIGSLARDVL